MTVERIILKATGFIFIVGGFLALCVALYVSFGLDPDEAEDSSFAVMLLVSIGVYFYAAILTALATGAALLGLDAVIGHLSAIEKSNSELVEQGKRVKRETAIVTASRPTLSAQK